MEMMTVFDRFYVFYKKHFITVLSVSTLLMSINGVIETWEINRLKDKVTKLEKKLEKIEKDDTL